MIIHNLSERELKKYKMLIFSKDICGTESLIYLNEKKNLIYKKFYVRSGDEFTNKLYTLSSLCDQQRNIDMDRLIFPKSLVSEREILSGILLPYIKGPNFQNVITSNEFSEREKLRYYREIGELINRVKRVRDKKGDKYPELKDFYLNDIHESNFILNNNTSVINALDIDSCKINGNKLFPAKYLIQLNKLTNLNKYPKEETKYSSTVIVNEQTELYCYTIMILNYLYKKDISKLSVMEFNQYIEYLNNLGINKELIDSFYNLYTENSNKNVCYLIDNLDEYVSKTNYEEYSLRRFK